MKKISLAIFLLIVIIVASIIFFLPNHNNEEINKNNEIANIIIEENKVDEIMENVYIKINDILLNIELENNSATRELKEHLKSGDVVVNAHEYGGFEKVGSLGFSLPREDKNINTSAGDIVLYQGNQISLFYDSNSWSYTKLGKIQDLSKNELKSLLGDGDVTITFTLSR
jgi:hypothetical protein